MNYSALNSKSKTIPLAMFALAAAVVTLVSMGTGTAEARGRTVTLTQNHITEINSSPADGEGAGLPCLLSYAEWEPLGSQVEVEFVLQSRRVNTFTWGNPRYDTQVLPGRASSASVEWNYILPNYEYRHLFRLYTVKGKDGADRNRQLVSEFSSGVLTEQGCSP